MNPQSPIAPGSRAGTSPAIQSAHAALAEKARDNSLVPHPLTKRTPDVSPERNFAKGAAHRRMQSLQPSSVRDLSLMIEGGALSTSPTKRDRPVTPSRSSTDPFTDLKSEKSERTQSTERTERSDEREDKPLNFTHAGPTVTPVIRPTPRRPQSILSENTPPQSATMLALHNMSTPKEAPREKEADITPLANVTNGSTAGSTAPSTAASRAPHSMDQLSNQILTLTNIATALQKEMSQLSRRSRDNATDLLSLKEATNTRDEDIRKNLRDLLHNMHDVQSRTVSRDSFGGPLMLDNKPYSLSPTSTKPGANPRPFSLPRIPSPHSFAASIDRESISTPSLVGTDAPASMGLLEKIIRDMGTKEGQEKLYSRLSELGEKLNGFNVEKKIEELQRLVKNNMDQSVVLAGAGGGGGGGKSGRSRHMSFDDDSDDFHNGSIGARFERLIQDQETRTRRSSTPTARAAADLISDDIIKIIRTVKDSVAQGGGLTAEVKALVRELRGEVLGMGREIGRRLDEVAETSLTKTTSATKSEIDKVVEEGLLEMKEHINHFMKEQNRQSQAVVAANKPPPVDYHEIYNAMRTALKDSKALQKDMPDLQREDVIDAVREAWETYKPEITVEQIGLERDEILACLKEGLMHHAPRNDQPQAATRDEVFDAIMEGLENFEPPPIEAPPTLSRDEIIEAVRDCLEEFEFPVAPSAIGADLSKQDMVDAVKQGLEHFDLPAKDNASLVPFKNKDEIVGRLHEIMEYMRAEFKAVSEEAKQNVAANGRDTEQVLDATKDGLEKLRSDIEGYVDRATGVAGQEEFMDGLLKSLDEFREDIEDLVVKQSDGSNQMIKEELGSLRDAVNGTLVPATPQPQQGNYQEVIHALQEGLGSLRHEISQRPIAGTNEVLDALQDGLTELKISIDKLANKPTDLSANDEVLDALKSGLDGVKSDIEGLREQSKALTTISSDVVPANALKHDDIKNLEVLLAQLHVKVEAIEAMPAQAAPAPAPAEPGLSLTKEDVDLMMEMLDSIKLQVEDIATKEPPAPKAATDAADGPVFEDVEAVETILRNTKARLDDLMDGEQAVRKDHVDALEVLILETKESLGGLTGKLDELSHKEDTKAVESLVTQVVGAFDEMKTRHDKLLEDPDKVTKTDTDAIGAVCLDVKTIIDQMVKSDIAALSSKEDMKNLQTLIEELKEISDKQTIELKESSEKQAKELRDAAEKHAIELKELTDKHAETTLSQFEERQAETVGVGERVTEVKTFLEEMHSLVKDRLDQGFSGVEGLSKSLGTIGETIGANANVHTDLKEMFDTMKTEFEGSKATIVGAKLESDEKFDQSTDSLRTKIDERIDEVISKYEEFQAAMEERNKTSEARDEQLEESIVGHKAIADELKMLIDTLGSAVTDSLEKMEDASKTVFTRVEDMVLKSDDNHTENKTEHAQTRDQVKEFMGVFEGFKGDINEYQPKILEAVKDVLLMVGQHFEHSKSSVTEIEEKIGQRIEEAKPEPLMLPPPPEQYDDSQVHEKLDKLVNHTGTASRAFEQLNTLDKVHQQVVLTAAELSAFLASQTQRIENDHDDREKSLQETEKRLNEATVALERRLAQKDHAEATVSGLHEEEDRLRQSIVELRVEQESLVRQKVQLTGDVSSLETALRLRREELHEMEARAEGLERRILEGVMDQSRILLMAKSAKKAASARDVVMSRKRVPSKQQKPTGAGGNVAEDAATTQQAPPKSKPHQKTAFATALNSKRNGESRRILSLSQLNKQAGLNAAGAAAGGAGGLGAAFKRSQSVKTLTGAGSLRKNSWGGRGLNSNSNNGGGGGQQQKSYGELHPGEGDKENVNLDVVALRESDEEGFDDDDDDDDLDGGDETPVSETGGEGVLVGGGNNNNNTTAAAAAAAGGGGDGSEKHPGAGSVYDDPSDTDTLRREDLHGSTTTGSGLGSGYDDAYDTYSDPGSDWTESAVGSGGGSGVGMEGSEVVLYDGIEGPD
ncbi:hypothetical protein VMCG_09851 [Cytospora schulzeri]|uniref:Uncharacterized protein n=1 Tax=Cytospora schulzeri TaxID=448051 RepID=A0A423VDQ0_9PEZI|nr:hypothetical protein VMCG_09851 [Valsa malicola]